MSFFKKPVVEASHDRDSLGGFSAPDTGIYEGTLTRIFGDQYGSGSQYIYLDIDTAQGRQVHRMIVTNKDGENTYTDKQSGEARALPGYAMIDSLSLVTVGQPLSALEWAEAAMKVMKDGKEVEEARLYPEALWGQPVKFAVEKKIKNKQEKGEDNKYYDTNEKEEVSEISKFFHVETEQTATELSHENAAEFIHKWRAKNLDENGVGITINKFKEVKEAPKSGALPTKPGKPAGALPSKPAAPGARGLPAGLPRKS